MVDLNFVETLAQLHAWLRRAVAISAGVELPGGPLDVLSVHGVLAAGWDLELRGDANGAVFFSLEGIKAPGWCLSRRLRACSLR